jgi:hypothetical protein
VRSERATTCYSSSFTTVSKWIEKERATCEISGALASSGEAALELVVDDGADDGGDVSNFYRRF